MAIDEFPNNWAIQELPDDNKKMARRAIQRYCARNIETDSIIQSELETMLGVEQCSDENNPQKAG